MADYQRVVEFLRDFRTAPVQTVTDEVRAAATDYAALCASANERLRQCAVLLQRGLRAEAINLAEASPNLLDLVAALDLPDAERWSEFCQRSDLPVPPQLQIDRASQLNDAYSQDQPLEKLFDTHRRLALCQAPVVKRLAVMRQIAHLDPSPFWEKDIRTFENARFKELRVHFANAVREKDLKKIMSLSSEVLDGAWAEAVPEDLRSAARDVDDRLRLAQFETAMVELVAKLRTAFAAKSLPECAALLGQAKELMTTHGRADLAGNAAAEIETAGAWVREENQARASREAFASACDALTAALDADAPEATLEAMLRAAQSHGQPVPPELLERYGGALRRRAKTSQRRLLLGLAAVTAVLLIALAVGYSVMQSRLAGGWAQRIHKAAADRDLALARQLIEEQERRAPKMNDVPGVASAKREVAVLQQESEGDAAIFHGALAALEEAKRKGEATAAADDAAQSNATPFNAAILADLREAATAAENALEQRRHLPNLAWVDSGNRLAAAAAQLESLRDDLKNRYSHDVLARIQAVAQKVEGMSAEPKAASLAAGETALAAMEQDLSAVRNYVEKGNGSEAALDAAVRKIADRRDALKHAREEFEARKTLASNVGTADSARAALEDFARRFPDSPLSKDLLKAAAATELAKSVEAWHLLCTPWLADAAPPNEKVAQQRLEAVRAFLRDNPTSPVAPRAAAYADYLQQAADAMAVTNTWQAEMNDILASPLISDLKYMQTSDGVKHYVLGEVTVRTQTLNDRVTYTFDAMDPSNLVRRRAVVVVPPIVLVSNKPVPVAHTQFAQTIAEELKTVDAGNWDTFGIGLVARIVAEDKIDTVVKAILLREALQATAKADSWAVGDAYEKPANDLVRQKLDQVVWYDPEHPVPDVTIANLRKIFLEVPRAADMKQRVVAKRDELFKGLRPKFAGEGLLLRDESGHWGIETSSPARLGGTAVVIVPAVGGAPPTARPATGAAGPADAGGAAAATPATFVQVAAWKGDKLVVDEAAVRDMPEGTMVLLTKP